MTINSLPFLLSDTVGFIRKLPHHLIESFKSTLDEVREADILIHVVDMAHPFHDNQIEVVTKTLGEIGAAHIPTILVLNKIDLVEKDPGVDFEERVGYYRGLGFKNVVFLSAVKKENLQVFKETLGKLVEERFMQIYPNYVKPAMSSYDFQPE